MMKMKVFTLLMLLLLIVLVLAEARNQNGNEETKKNEGDKGNTNDKQRFSQENIACEKTSKPCPVCGSDRKIYWKGICELVHASCADEAADQIYMVLNADVCLEKAEIPPNPHPMTGDVCVETNGETKTQSSCEWGKAMCVPGSKDIPIIHAGECGSCNREKVCPSKDKKKLCLKANGNTYTTICDFYMARCQQYNKDKTILKAGECKDKRKERRKARLGGKLKKRKERKRDRKENNGKEKGKDLKAKRKGGKDRAKALKLLKAKLRNAKKKRKESCAQLEKGGCKDKKKEREARRNARRKERIEKRKERRDRRKAVKTRFREAMKKCKDPKVPCPVCGSDREVYWQGKCEFVTSLCGVQKSAHTVGLRYCLRKKKPLPENIKDANTCAQLEKECDITPNKSGKTVTTVTTTTTTITSGDKGNGEVARPALK